MKLDTLTNMIAALRVGKAKTSADTFSFSEITLGEAEAMYRADWVARKAVDIPVADMLRPWRSWQASPDQIAAMERAEKRHDVKAKLCQALTWARLYGGAGILIGDGNPFPSQPFVPETLKKGGLRYLTVLPRQSLKSSELEFDPQSPNFLKPKSYTLSTQTGSILDVHPTRVIRLIGAEVPGIDRNPEGWGDSILQIIRDAVHHFALASAAGAELVHEAKIDVIKIPNLEAMLATQAGTQNVAARFSAASMLKSINNTLLLGTGEEYERKQTTFAGIKDLVQLYLQIVAGATDIPATRLAGQSPGGLNATGDNDVRNYYDMLDGQRQLKVRPVLEQLDTLLWLDETGSVPKDAYFEFDPLWQPTEAEKATTAKVKAETTQIYVSMGLLPEDALAVGVANQLIEDGVYPGAEEQLAKVQSAATGFGEDPEEVDSPSANQPERIR